MLSRSRARKRIIYTSKFKLTSLRAKCDCCILDIISFDKRVICLYQRVKSAASDL